MLGAASALRTVSRAIATHPLTQDRQLAAWLRFAGWIAASRLNREVTVRWIEGQRLVVRRGMTGATGNVYLGLHEFMSMMLTLHFLREDDLFFDVGANVGAYIVLSSGVSGATTWVFEPDEQAGRDLLRNVDINRLADRVEFYPVALGPTEGEVLFTRGKGAMNRVAMTTDEESHSVKQRTLDSIAKARVPNMIKLDVEGYEEQVLQGALKTLADATLKLIALEGTIPTGLRLLKDNGFERAFYDPFTRILQREPNSLAYKDGKWTLSNEFYVRDWDFVATRLVTARPILIGGRAI